MYFIHLLVCLGMLVAFSVACLVGDISVASSAPFLSFWPPKTVLSKSSLFSLLSNCSFAAANSDLATNSLTESDFSDGFR